MLGAIATWSRRPAGALRTTTRSARPRRPRHLGHACSASATSVIDTGRLLARPGRHGPVLAAVASSSRPGRQGSITVATFVTRMGLHRSSPRSDGELEVDGDEAGRHHCLPARPRRRWRSPPQNALHADIRVFGEALTQPDVLESLRQERTPGMQAVSAKTIRTTTGQYRSAPSWKQFGLRFWRGLWSPSRLSNSDSSLTARVDLTFRARTKKLKPSSLPLTSEAASRQVKGLPHGWQVRSCGCR